MSLKDLFGNASDKVISNKQLQDLYEQAESEGYLEELLEDKERYQPAVDFSNPVNFAIYGSAERYYVDGITNIYQNYPYDGSKKEKQEWRNLSSQLDNYIFDNIYPKTTGHVTFSGSTPSVLSSYRSSSNAQYVIVKGGPNPSQTGKFETSNIYDLNTNRESNLGITEHGNTVEFWFKDNTVSGSAFSQAKYALFDLWNGVDNTAGNYTRLIIAKKQSAIENKFIVTYASDSSGIDEYELSYNFDPFSWHHYAFTFGNAGASQADLEVCLYVDGDLATREVISGGGGITLADNANLTAFIGAYRSDPNGGNTFPAGFAASFGSYDEFRFWKTVRTSRQIYRNWFTQVGGGTNTDDANTSLGLYFKFNEGIIDSGSINSLDAVCVDYSGRVSNGTIYNYSLSCKSTSSAIDIYFDKVAEGMESKDPIIFSSNPLVQNIITQYAETGFQYDVTNTSGIYKKIPSWITEDAEKENYPDLQRLVQIISSYFDTLHLQISKLSSIKNIEYAAESDKPKPFYSNILNSHGFDNIEIFNDTTFLEDVLSRSESDEFEEKVNNVKNIIYQNIYNNLSYIYKSKGTEKAFRNLIRSFGIDNELVKINLYANNAEYDFSNKYNYTSVSKKFIDFNSPDRNSGAIIQKNKTGDSNTRGYIAGAASGKLDYAPITVQTEIIFPKKSDGEFDSYYTTNFTDVSLFGCHTANSNDSILTWHNNDNFNFQVYAIKSDINNPDVYFKLTGSLSGSGFNITSSIYKNVYDNQKWNLAVRIKPKKLGYVSYSSGSYDTNYVIEFVGFNSLLDTAVNDTFILSASIAKDDAQSALRENKRLYVGAHYNNYNSSSVLAQTDVKISSVRYWLDYLTNEELQVHSFDASNYGTTYPNWRPEFITENLIITKADMLLLNWSFDNVTSSDTNGELVVEDISSGSVGLTNRYGISWLGDVVGYQQSGFGFGFDPSDTQVANKEYIYSAKIAAPEIFNGSDMIQIPDTDDFIREKTPKPLSFYFSIEKSMAQVINDEILNWLATIKNFNNLIGQPNQRYKKEYSDLIHLRKLFFEKVNNEPDYEKFLEFYKWIDSSISMMIGQLAPASSNVSDKVRNIIENTVLDRNKYQNKVATIEYKDTIVPLVGTAHNFTYPLQKAPQSPAGALWYKQRAIRTQEVSGGIETITTPLEPQNDIDREIIRQVINYSSYGKGIELYDVDSDSLYEGNKDLNRSFSRHYKLLADKLLIIEGTIIGNEISNISSSNVFQFASDIAASSNQTQVLDPFNSRFSINSKPMLFDVATSASYEGVRKSSKTVYKFKNPYEYFQTSGRSTNNKSFVDLEGKVFLDYSINPLNIVERALPNRAMENGGARKTIFVERFSAPGGPEVNGRGMLDPVAEEFSVYNGLNNRNLRVRKFLDSWMRESGSIDSSFPSYHKIIKNVVRYPGDETGATVNEQTDNGFISHAIPRSDAQYAWITASMSGNDIFSGYDSEYDNLNKGYQFLSSSFLFNLVNDYYIPYNNYRFFGIYSIDNVITSKVYDTSSNTISTGALPTAIGAPNQFRVFINSLNGPYQYPSWKQIRNSENPLVILSKKNNNVTVQDAPRQKFKADKFGNLIPYVDKRSDTFTTYREPPVEYNIPMKHTMEVSGSTGSFDVISSYDNNKDKFANAALMSATGQSKRDEKQAHEVLVSLANGEYKPEPIILSASYTSMILPTKEHVGLKETRTRPNYTEEAGTGSNGYDRNVAEIRTFWRDSLANRKRTNAFYSSSKTGSLNSLNIAQLSASATSSAYTGYVRYSGSLAYIPQITASKNYKEYYDAVNSLENNNSYSINLVSGTNYTENQFSIDSSIMGDLAGFDEVEARNFLSLPSGTYELKQISIGIGSEKKLAYYFKYDPSYNLVRPKPSYSYKIHYPSISSFYEVTRTNLNKVYNYKQFINEGIVYSTNILAGKNSWYDNYEKYFEDLRPYSTNKTIIPEYCFSEHADFYIKDNNGQLKGQPPDNYISFIGSDVSVNAIDNAYNITDKLDNFILNDLDGEKKIKLQIDGIKKLLPYKGFYPQERTVQIVDLFQKSFFDVSMIDVIDGYPTYNGISSYPSGSPLLQQIQTLLQPYFAPGILYNTIKSGIAMDWPAIFTGSADATGILGGIKKGPVYAQDQEYPSTTTGVPFFYTTSSFGTSSINEKVFTLKTNKFTRLPFESLINLQGYQENINDTLYYLDPTRVSRESFEDVGTVNGNPSSSLRYNPQFGFNNINSTNNQSIGFKDNRYKQAIENFLAEIPSFFLENQKLTSFTSTKKSFELQFDKNMSYQMEIIIQKDRDFEMLLDTTASYDYNYVSDSSGIYTSPTNIPVASVFGPPTQYVLSSSASENTYGHKLYDAPSYAPYVPPYFYGPQKMKLIFNPKLDGNYTYEQIITELTISCEPANEDTDNYFSSSVTNLGGDASSIINTTAYRNLMPLSSSLLNVILPGYIIEKSLNGNVDKIINPNDGSQDKWRIQTKFETPTLNFSSSLNKSLTLTKEYNYSFSTSVVPGFPALPYDVVHSSSLIKFGFTGMWGGYALPSEVNKGISLTIQDIKNNNSTASLAQICGFQPQTKYIGQIAQKKQIGEAIVMIPFTKIRNHIGVEEQKIDASKAITIPEIIGEKGNNTNGPYYFNVDKNIINDIFKDNNISIDFRDTKVTYQDIKNLLITAPNISNNSILNAMKLMTEYVIPPHLDWIFDRTIKPFAMYIFEFTQDLNGSELADIWQGVMPDSAMSASKDSVSIEHAFTEKEFFHGKKLPDDIQWKVFKVKKRANYLYDSLVNGKEERFEFKPGTSEELVYSYNWPYDYFSLVELVNIKASLEVEKSDTKPQETIINPTEIVKALQEPNAQKAIENLANKTFKKTKK